MPRARRLPVSLALIAILAALPSFARPVEMILSVVVNGEKKGEFFVRRSEDGDMLIRPEDLGAVGLKDVAGKVETIDGTQYLSLRSIAGVSVVFVERTLTLEVVADPRLLPKRTIDFTPERRKTVLYPKDPSAFLNYGVNFTEGTLPGARDVSVTAQLGVRPGDVLFLSDASYDRSSATERFVRLQTSATYDWRKEMRRLVAGDFFASSGELGSTLNLGGVSVSRVFRIDPYFIGYPLADFSGVVALPSDAEIFINGARVRTEKLAPGGFELKNISYFGGVGDVVVVIKDPFGREQRISYPFYFTDAILREGLHEYSYNAGAQRKEFGVESNRYGGAAFSAFHRYGASDRLTVGLRAEGADGRFNIGPQASFLFPRFGLASLSLSGSGGEGAGVAAAFSHSYQQGGLSARLVLRALSRDYATAAGESLADKVKSEVAAGAGYATPKIGSVSLDYDAIRKHAGQDRRTAGLSYSRSLRRNLSLFASLKKVREAASVTEIFAGLIYYPRPGMSATSSFKRSGSTGTETVQFQKNLPVGEGVGYRASLERSEAEAASATAVNPSVQYNARFGGYSAEYLGRFPESGGSSSSYRLTAAGGIAWVGGTFGFSRPISDSFGLVTVDNLAAVRVSVNNQEIGRTDRSGRLFLPNLASYFENQVSIDDKDVPIDYTLSEVMRTVSPPLRSGSVIPFAAKKFQAVTGFVRLRREGETKPLEFYEGKVAVAGKEIAFPTGKGGEFYLEDIPPGTHRAQVQYNGNRCGFDIVVPRSDEMIVDLGVLFCEDVR